MKKTIKMLGLLLVAAAMFAGCKNAPAETSSNKSPLFPAGDTPVTMTGRDFFYTDLADGTWSFKRLYEYSGNTTVEEYTFTKSGSTLTITKGATNSSAWNSDKLARENQKMANESNYHNSLYDFLASSSVATDITLKKNSENTKFYSNYKQSLTINGQQVPATITAWLKKN